MLTLSHNALLEIYYHTWILKSGSHTFIYSGDKKGLDKAVARIWKEHPPYKPTIKKVV